MRVQLEVSEHHSGSSSSSTTPWKCAQISHCRHRRTVFAHVAAIRLQRCVRVNMFSVVRLPSDSCRGLAPKWHCYHLRQAMTYCMSGTLLVLSSQALLRVLGCWPGSGGPEHCAARWVLVKCLAFELWFRLAAAGLYGGRGAGFSSTL